MLYGETFKGRLTAQHHLKQGPFGDLLMKRIQWV